MPVPVHARQPISGSKLPMHGSDLPCNRQAVAAAFFLPPPLLRRSPDLSMHATYISNSNQIVFTFRPCSSIGGIHAALSVSGRQENLQTFCTHQIVNAGVLSLVVKVKPNKIERVQSSKTTVQVAARFAWLNLSIRRQESAEYTGLLRRSRRFLSKGGQDGLQMTLLEEY